MGWKRPVKTDGSTLKRARCGRSRMSPQFDSYRNDVFCSTYGFILYTTHVLFFLTVPCIEADGRWAVPNSTLVTPGAVRLWFPRNSKMKCGLRDAKQPKMLWSLDSMPLDALSRPKKYYQKHIKNTSKGQTKLLDVAGAGLLPEILPSSWASRREHFCSLTLARLFFFWLTCQFGLQPFVVKGNSKRTDSATAEQPCQWQRRWMNMWRQRFAAGTLSAVLCFKKRPQSSVSADNESLFLAAARGGPFGRRTHVRFDFKEAGREAGDDREHDDKEWDFGVPGCHHFQTNQYKGYPGAESIPILVVRPNMFDIFHPSWLMFFNRVAWPHNQ